MSNGRIVNEVAILEIVDQLRTTIPEEVKASRQIQQQKERIIAQGKEEANRIIDIARQQANGILTNHELLRAAEARSLTIIERAQREAGDIRRGADGYAEQVLTVLDERIAHAQHQIRSGLQELGSRRGDAAPAEENKEKTAEPISAELNLKQAALKPEVHS
jgi:hypothetical protein